MITQVTRDTMKLPLALLPKLKAHARIDHCDDDELIVDKLAMILERFEIKNGVVLFEASYTWEPEEWANGRIQVPRPPVRSFTATIPGDPSAVDVSADYSIMTNGWGGEIAPQWLVGTWQTDLEVTILAGYLDTALPPGIRDLILRGAAHLYDYREIYVGSNVEIQASWIDDWIAGYWQANC